MIASIVFLAYSVYIFRRVLADILIKLKNKLLEKISKKQKKKTYLIKTLTIVSKLSDKLNISSERNSVRTPRYDQLSAFSPIASPQNETNPLKLISHRLPPSYFELTNLGTKTQSNKTGENEILMTRPASARNGVVNPVEPLASPISSTQIRRITSLNVNSINGSSNQTLNNNYDDDNILTPYLDALYGWNAGNNLENQLRNKYQSLSPLRKNST